MADFCKECSKETWGEDFKDLAGITSPEEFAEGKAAVVLCEGCGAIQVDPNGKCLGNCLNKNHGRMREAMSDNGPCNCEQSQELTEVLKLVIACAEEGCFGGLLKTCTDDCTCIICDVREVLKKWKGEDANQTTDGQ